MSKYNNSIIFCLIVLLLFSINVVKAAHIIGGDMTYSCVEIDSVNQQSTFDIEVIMYRDSKGGGAQFDDPARFGLFSGSGQNWDFLEQIRTGPFNEADLTFVENPCITIPPNVGVQSGNYKFRITLDWIDQNYKIAYQRCCRNNTITNLISPQSTGAVFEVDITPEAQRSCNNSPKFNSFPPIVLCANIAAVLDLSVTDKEGHQVFYEFCAPKSSGGQSPGVGCDAVIPQPMNCLPPFGTANFLLPNYSITNPLGASANMALDPNTGILTLKPQLIGQFVVAICVKEFKNGKILSEIIRDFQFNVAACEDLVVAEVNTSAPGTTIQFDNEVLTVESCFNKTILFNNNSTSQIGAPSYTWEFNANGTKLQSTDANAVITFPEVGEYNGIMVVNPSNGGCTDTAKIKVVIHPEVIADFTFAYDTCKAGPIEFYDGSSTTAPSSIESWKWKLSSKDSTITQNPIFTYREPGYKAISLEVEDSNACLDTILKEIRWIPVPDILLVEPSEFAGCVPASIFFNNLSYPIDSTYKTKWTFGDGNEATIISPTNIYQEAGTYDVNLEVVSPEGCVISRFYPKLIEVSPAPIADFDFDPKTGSNFNNDISFYNSSQFVSGWYWDFDTDDFSFEENPTYSFQDTGLHLVQMIGYHQLGCSDTITKLVDIQPISTIYPPNAFTPNNDGLNDQFKPEGVFFGITDYQLSIWDRWGAKIFESNEFEKGWNGEYLGNGNPSPKGIYVYQINYVKPRGEKVKLEGQLSLIR